MDHQEKEPAAPPVIPVRLKRYEDAPRYVQRYWLHPTSALLILLIDWLFFAEEAATFGLLLPVSCLLAFVTTTAGVYWVQRKKNQDPRGTAVAKALFGGIVAGLPMSIGGTILGTAVLILGGLNKRPNIGMNRPQS